MKFHGNTDAVAAFGPAVAQREQRDLVAEHLLGQSEGDAGRQRREVGSAGRALALEALVALHALVGGVARLAFLEDDLDAVDAAVALVEQRVVVGRAVGERNAVRSVGAGAIDQPRQELLVPAPAPARRSLPGRAAAAARASVLRSICISSFVTARSRDFHASLCSSWEDRPLRIAGAPVIPARPQ